MADGIDEMLLVQCKQCETPLSQIEIRNRRRPSISVDPGLNPGSQCWWALQGKRQDFPWFQNNHKPCGHTPPDFPDLIREDVRP
jgi:hypothetical protein